MWDMGTIKRFEELEIWQLAYQQCNDFDQLVQESALKSGVGLRNQMNTSSGSVRDNIAEGFERSGNNEFKNFLLIAKGSNGEYRSQLYRCLNRKYLSKEKFDELYNKNVLIGNKLMAFFSYLKNSLLKGQRYKKG
jgi:four helix bundle protein